MWPCTDVNCGARNPAPLKMCPACHAFAVFRVHARDTPPAPDYSHNGAYQPPSERLHRPSSSGRRVFRNEKALQ